MRKTTTFMLAILLAASCVLLFSSCSKQETSSKDPKDVLNVYFDAWGKNEDLAAYMGPNYGYAGRGDEEVKSLTVKSITEVKRTDSTAVYLVKFDYVTDKPVSMETGEYTWTYYLTKDLKSGTWLITNYGS